MYEKLSKELVDNAAWIWLFTPKEYIVLNSSVNGFEARYDADVSTLWKATLSCPRGRGGPSARPGTRTPRLP